jgi:hypothetical protein
MVNNMASPMDDFSIYYIEEKISEKYLQMAQNELLSEDLDPLTFLERKPRSRGTGAEGGIQEWSMTTRHQEDTMDGTWDTTEDGHQEDVMDGHMSKEGGEVLAPPPIPTPSDQWCVPPPFFHPYQLNLVLDLRCQMEDQAYCGALMNQCMDILYEDFSDAPTKKICLTCTRLYGLPARNEMPSEEPNNEDLNG